MYKESSVSEKGTLTQLKVLLNHKRVTFPNNKITNFDACDDFFKIVLSSHVIAAAMELLNMTSLEDEPANDSLLPADGWLEDNETRKDLLYAFSSKIVSKFIDIESTFIVTTSRDDDDKVLIYSKLSY